MSFTQLSTDQAPMFSGMESEGFGAPSPAPSNPPAAATGRHGGDKTATAPPSLMGQARTEDERAFVEQLYEQAIEEGPPILTHLAIVFAALSRHRAI